MTTVAFISETPGSATAEEQKAGLGPDDLVVVAGTRSLSQLGELLARSGMPLKAGDCVRIFNLNCLALSTPMLIRALTRLLGVGVSIDIVKPGLTISPDDPQGPALLRALDGHYRHVHGIKTHPTESAAKGRRRVLTAEQMPMIREMMAKPGMTAALVAKELGIGRSTLFNYLERFNHGSGVDRRDEAVKRGAKNVGNERHILEGNSK